MLSLAIYFRQNKSILCAKLYTDISHLNSLSHTHYTLGHDKTTYARDLWTLLTVMHINTRSPKLRYDTIRYDSRV